MPEDKAHQIYCTLFPTEEAEKEFLEHESKPPQHLVSQQLLQPIQDRIYSHYGQDKEVMNNLERYSRAVEHELRAKHNV